MICGYLNINNFCFDKYSYEYATFIKNNRYAIVDDSILAPVYRIDKNTKEKILLESNSTIRINNCDINDEDTDITAWECYLIYKNNNGIIDYPSLESYRDEQIKNINVQYNNFLNNGILIKINNFATNMSTSVNGAYSNITISEKTKYSILLPALKDDVINFSNTLSLATLMNANDDSDPLPPLIDYYNNAHYLNYYNLTNILSNYFNKLKNAKLILDKLTKNINNASTIDDIQQQIFYTTSSTINYNNSTNASTKNSQEVKFNY